jgi:hypothetical protein
MSYEILKSIRFDEETKEVFIRSASNNVYPKDYTESSNSYFSDLWIKEGKDSLVVDLLKQYIGGMMQGGLNSFSKTLNNASKMIYSKYKDEIHRIEDEKSDAHTKIREEYKLRQESEGLKYNFGEYLESIDYKKACELCGQKEKEYSDLILNGWREYQEESVKSYVVYYEHKILDWSGGQPKSITERQYIEKKKARSILMTEKRELAKVFKMRLFDIKKLFSGYKSKNLIFDEA